MKQDEDGTCFCRRRNRVIQTIKFENKLNVKLQLCFKVTTWLEHLLRHPNSIGCQFLFVQDRLWFRTTRMLTGNMSLSVSVDAGRTGARSGPGAPIRFLDNWFEQLSEQGCFVNANRCKRTSKAHAENLFT